MVRGAQIISVSHTPGYYTEGSWAKIFRKNYTLHLVVTVLVLAGSGCKACVLQFTIDQLVGVSGKKLSFATYWLI